MYNDLKIILKPPLNSEFSTLFELFTKESPWCQVSTYDFWSVFGYYRTSRNQFELIFFGKDAELNFSKWTIWSLKL